MKTEVKQYNTAADARRVPANSAAGRGRWVSRRKRGEGNRETGELRKGSESEELRPLPR